jgi:predicted dehydrogenase
VKCCHENESRIYGESPEACKELLDFCGENLGCVFDFANGADPMQAYEMLKPYITYFHIKDHDGKFVVAAGEGKGRIAEILADFDSTSVEPVWLSAEPHLKVFDGLGGFDKESAEKLAGRTVYASNEESFGAACDAMHLTAKKAQPVELGIIGFGNMGTSHAKNYLGGQMKRTRITAIADINPERLEAAKEILPGVAVFDSAEALIKSGMCNAALIATPHYDHPPQAIMALKAGLHVLTEKPAGVYTKQVREMNEAAQKSGAIFAIMYNQRSKPLHQEIHKLIASGKYGELKRFIWIINSWYRTQAYYDSGGWRATWAGEGGGVLINQCPHQLDLWQWFVGMPCNVRASCHEGRWHDIEVEDDATIYADYENGATGVFVSSTGDAAGTNRLEITLDRAKLVLEDAKLTITELEESTKEHLLSCKDGFGSIKSEVRVVEDSETECGEHAMVYNAFAAAIAENDPSLLYARGEEGINGLSISNAAHLSSWLGKDVALPLDEELFYAELQKKIAGSKTKENVSGGVVGDMSGTF